MAENDGWIASFFGLAFVTVYYGVAIAMFWWSCRVVWWFFTGGDFPLPWQPFG